MVKFLRCWLFPMLLPSPLPLLIFLAVCEFTQLFIGGGRYLPLPFVALLVVDVAVLAKKTLELFNFVGKVHPQQKPNDEDCVNEAFEQLPPVIEQWLANVKDELELHCKHHQHRQQYKVLKGRHKKYKFHPCSASIIGGVINHKLGWLALQLMPAMELHITTLIST